MWDLGVQEQFGSIEATGIYYNTTYTDFEINNFQALSSRYYAVNLVADWAMDTAGRWDIYLRIDGTSYAKLGTAICNGTGINEDCITGRALWTPSDGEYDLSVHATKAVGTSGLNLYADSATPRQFWVEDIGPR
jgi:hypothetical protein